MLLWETENVLERRPLSESLLPPPRAGCIRFRFIDSIPSVKKNRILKLRRLTEWHPQVTPFQRAKVLRYFIIYVQTIPPSTTRVWPVI